MSLNAAQLRAHVLRRSLFTPTGLAAAIARMGFVQADPIRAPARAQDLILRHRAVGYRAGELERRYPELDLDEDVVYAYGFVPPSTRQLLHPRGGEGPDGLAREVLELVRRAGPTHPRHLVRELGDRSELNAWGGRSRATTRALEQLHYRGLLRVARREAGVRLYEAARPLPEALAPEERLRRLALLLADLFAPLPEASLRALLRQTRHAAPGLGDARATVVQRLERSGELERGTADGVAYVWPAGAGVGERTELPRTVRLLAPFDPVVWDRRRLEHLWGWAYRFEAYTPAPRRQFGYYALPLLWAERFVGWANVSAADDAPLDVRLGFVRARPRDRAFTRALDAEVARFAEFLGERPAER